MTTKSRKLTKREIEDVRKLSPYLTLEQLADFFGVSERTFYRIKERQPEVEEAFKKGKSTALAKVAQNLVQKALDGNITASIFYLKTRGGWSETNRTEIAMESNDGPTEIVIRSVEPSKHTTSS